MDRGYDDPTPVLKPGALFAERALRDKSRLKAYNQLLEQIYSRIKGASRLGPAGNAWILYTVPPFVFGLPKIDLEDCIVYLVFQLRQADYEVRYTYPNLLYISWKHHERNYILKDSPIMKAMLPTPASPVPVPRSALPGKKLQNRSSMEPTTQKSVGEYAPPNAFMNAMNANSGNSIGVIDPSRKESVLNDLFRF